MFTLCVRLSGCDIEAQDIFQEGFIDVFSSISAFRNEATIGAWMKIIFTRKAYKSYRKKLWVEDIDALEENELVDWRNEINTEHCSKYFYDVFVDYRKNNARTSQFRNNTGLQFGARFGIAK
jgi:DNA-directed RNA polymerase specialized sigma24 family protein